jgi:opacity protein-like surface antigen
MSILQPRRLALALLASAAAAPALAGGFAEPVATPVVAPVAVTPVVVAPSGEWTGGYVGAQLGFGDFTDNDVEPTLEGNGATFGLNAGYNRDFGRFVLGGEVQFDGTGIEADNELEDVTEEVDSVFRAGVRAGYDAGRFLPYVTGGYASASVSFDTALGDFDDGTSTGSYLGVGVDYS